MTDITGDSTATIYLFQQLSVALQKEELTQSHFSTCSKPVASQLFIFFNLNV